MLLLLEPHPPGTLKMITCFLGSGGTILPSGPINLIVCTLGFFCFMALIRGCFQILRSMQASSLEVKVHDARLFALMISQKVKYILTFNTADFTCYSSEGIVAVDPAAV